MRGIENTAQILDASRRSNATQMIKMPFLKYISDRTVHLRVLLLRTKCDSHIKTMPRSNIILAHIERLGSEKAH
jgi:hypothetical protein